MSERTSSDSTPLELVGYHLKEYKKDPSAQNLAKLAETLRKCGLIDEAIRVGEEGLSSGSGDQGLVGGGLTLALCYVEKGDSQKAVGILEQMVSKVPENLVAQKLLAKCYVKLGRTQAALYPLQSILSHNPEDTDAKDLLAQISPVESAEPDDEPMFKKKGISDPMSQLASGFKIGDVRTAFKLEESEKESLTTNTMANIYLKQGFIEKAIDIYKALLTRHPDDQKLKELIAELESKQLGE